MTVTALARNTVADILVSRQVRQKQHAVLTINARVPSAAHIQGVPSISAIMDKNMIMPN